MTLRLLVEQPLEFLSLKGGCTGWSESTLVKCHIIGNHMLRLIWEISLLQFPKRVNSTADIKAVRGVYWSDLCNI